MKKLFHPLSVLATVALPFVLYSVWRTGYQVTQLFDVRLFGTRYVFEVVLLTLVVAICCFGFRKQEKKVFSIVTGCMIVAFLALQATEEWPTDYKLWIYVVAPIFAWSLTLCSAFVFALKSKTEANKAVQTTAITPPPSTSSLAPLSDL